MGDIKKLRKKYSGPSHPWQKQRIEAEKKLLKEYGLKNKREIWKIESKLKSFANQAKKLIATRGLQAEKERRQLIEKLHRLGLVQKDAKLDDILSLTLKNLLERRLETLLYRKGFARTPKQARQFITHEHVTVAGKKITAPSYLVNKQEEPQITFITNSALANPEHPERAIVEKKK